MFALWGSYEREFDHRHHVLRASGVFAMKAEICRPATHRGQSCSSAARPFEKGGAVVEFIITPRLLRVSLVLREQGCGFFESEWPSSMSARMESSLATDAIRPSFVVDPKVEYDVAGADGRRVFDQLYDVAAVFPDSTTSILSGVVEGECGRCAFRIELRGPETGLAAAPCALPGPAVEHGESSHFGLSGVDSIGISAGGPDVVDLLTRHDGAGVS